MNLLYGSAIDFPPRADDGRGVLVTTDDPATIVSQAIADIVETTKGERVMLPDYGISDWVFAVQDRTFVTRIADELERQIYRYVPYIRKVNITGGTDADGQAELHITYELMTEINAPRNLTYPVWRLAEGATTER